MDDEKPQLTPAARTLAHCYARLLDLVERCTQAVHAGDWVLLNDEAGELSVVADEVSAAAAALTRDETATDPTVLLALIKKNKKRDAPS
ncbi:hypothetical protein [Kitasatospora sp. GP82]|uniref:hypothetical protein n=1 Tax=Kitasatospora sp. GP82 TaxID=3035089 RepID=UPI002473F434|nr:hypothetical protein [Kitasatospora sp. GP82]MDH6130346.1 hypothetical protein [Kitasatospora sp. GP82]